MRRLNSSGTTARSRKTRARLGVHGHQRLCAQRSLRKQLDLDEGETFRFQAVSYYLPHR